MENYLVDRETLGQFIDSLIEQKYPGQPAEDHAEMREGAIRDLDERIGAAIFGSLSDTQLAEVNALMDSGIEEMSIYEDFFKRSGVNISQVITGAMQTFKTEFLGGTNA